jgi:hypothetical protein
MSRLPINRSVLAEYYLDKQLKCIWEENLAHMESMMNLNVSLIFKAKRTWLNWEL